MSSQPTSCSAHGQQTSFSIEALYTSIGGSPWKNFPLSVVRIYYLAGELKEKHEDEDNDERIENGTLEDISESEFDVPRRSTTVCRIPELFSLVQEGVEVVFMASKSE